MTNWLSLALGGIPLGAMYALQAMGIVLVYKTSGVFNFAQGAIGMVAAFAAAQLGVNWGWPVPVAVLAALALGVAIGLAMEATSVRWVGGQLQRTIVTLAWLLGLQAVVLATTAQSATRPYLDVVSPASAFSIQSPVVLFYSWSQLTVIAVTVVIALGLGWYLRTRPFGVAMRAVADGPEGARLLGIDVHRVTLVSWGLGSGMGALAGILVTPLLGRLDTTTLIIFTIQALAAALVGRLSSLPMTLVGGVVLGMTQPLVVNALGTSSGVAELTAFVFILVALLTRRRTGRGDSGAGGLEPVPFGPLPRPRVAAGLVGVLGLTTGWLLVASDPGSRAYDTTILFVFAIGTLSIVLLSGVAGQVSLCQASFMGVGGFAAAIVYEAYGTGTGAMSLPLFLAAVVVGGLAAALTATAVGLPALRLRGLELAIVTLSLAFAADRYFFAAFKPLVGPETRRDMGRPFADRTAELSSGSGTFEITDGRPLAVLALLLFLLLAWWVASLRRGRTGAAFTALRSSTAATSAMGFSTTRVKLTAFAMSGFVAGVGGALYAALTSQAGANAFMFDRSITLLAYAVIVGLGSVPGAFLGGLIVAVQESGALAGGGTEVAGSSGAWLDLVTAVVLVVVLVGAPRGLTGVVTDLRARLAGWRRRATSATAEVAPPPSIGADDLDDTVDTPPALATVGADEEAGA